MESRKSFCNGTMIKNDMVRFWPLWGILFAGLQLMYTLPMFFYGLSYMRRHEWKGTRKLLLQEGARKIYGVANPYMIAIFAILAAILVFGYLFRKKEAYMLHGLPVNRRVFFCSHFLSGLLMLLVPFLSSCLMVGGICAAFGGNLAGVMVGVLMQMVIMIVFFYAMACLVVMLCGNAAMSVVIYLVANVLVAGMLMLVGHVSDSVLNDTVQTMASSEMSNGMGNLMISATPVIQFRGIMISPGQVDVAEDWKEGFVPSYVVSRIREDAVDTTYDGDYSLPWNQVGAMAWYLIPALLFLALAFYLYGRRDLERVGDTLAFPLGKSVFHFVFSVCGGLIFAEVMFFLTRQLMIQYDATYRTLFWAMMGYLFLGCVLCYFISNMLIQKTFFIWKNMSYAGLGICVLFVLGLMAFFRYDCYHGELPGAKEVKRLEMEIDNGGEFSTGTIIVERREDVEGILEALRKVQGRAEDVPMTEFGLVKHYSFHFDLEEGDLDLQVDCLGMDYFQKEYQKISSVIDYPKTMIEKIFTKDYAKLREDEFMMMICEGTEEDGNEEETWDGDDSGDEEAWDGYDSEEMPVNEDEGGERAIEIDSKKKEMMQALKADLETGQYAFDTIFQGGGDYIKIVLRFKENGTGDKSGKRYESYYGGAIIRLGSPAEGRFEHFQKARGDLVPAD